MSRAEGLADPKIRDIYNKYLKYHQGEAFLFGKKGAYADNKYVWVAVAKDEYTPGEIISQSANKLVVRTDKGEWDRYSVNALRPL